MELDLLYILAGRIFTSMAFFEVENPDEGCITEPIKNDKISNFLEKVKNFISEFSDAQISFFNVFFIIVIIFSDS